MQTQQEKAGVPLGALAHGEWVSRSFHVLGPVLPCRAGWHWASSPDLGAWVNPSPQVLAGGFPVLSLSVRVLRREGSVCA